MAKKVLQEQKFETNSTKWYKGSWIKLFFKKGFAFRWSILGTNLISVWKFQYLKRFFSPLRAGII